MKKRRINRKLGLLCGIVAMLWLCAGCGSGKASSQKTDAGYAALESSDFRNAESLFQEAISEGEEEIQA